MACEMGQPSRRGGRGGGGGHGNVSGGEEAGKERPHRCDGDNGAPAAIPRWGGGGRGRRRPKDNRPTATTIAIAVNGTIQSKRSSVETKTEFATKISKGNKVRGCFIPLVT
jgi:hypothetical protein